MCEYENIRFIINKHKKIQKKFKTDNVNIKNCSTLCKTAANMTLCFKEKSNFQNQQTSYVFERHNQQQKR